MKFCFCITLPETPLLAAVTVAILSTLVTCVYIYWNSIILYWQDVLRRARRPFGYRKLRDNEIRLLVIKRGHFSDPVIRCAINHVELSQRPEYQALSYVWGDATTTKTIVCSGKEIQIGVNLYVALRRLRSQKQDCILWVDAICINQKDDEEKGAQVALMGRIYSLATQVLVWLGEEEAHEGKRAFAFLGNMHKFFTDQSRSYASGGLIQPSPEVRNVIEQMDLTVLKKLFDRPWFHRLWVVQEVVKAQEAMLVFGTNSMPWSQLASVVTALQAVDGGSLLKGRVGDTAAQNVISIVMAARNQERYQLREDSSYSIVTLLYLLRCFNCKDSRDRIYALLGLAWSEGLLPTYLLTEQEATCKFVEWCFKTDVSLHFLCHAGISTHGSQHNLPSWFPQVSRDYSPRFVIGSNVHFNASKVPSAITNRNAMFEGMTIDGNVLILTGSNVDNVTAMTDIFLPYNPELRSVDDQTDLYVNLAKMITGCLALARKCLIFEDVFSDEKYIQFCNTISAGQWRLVQGSQENLGILIFRIKNYLESKDVTGLMGRNKYEFDKVFPMANRIAAVLSQRRFATTSGSRLALVPRLAQLADIIAVFRGAKVPFVVRERKDGYFTLIGECYVPGLMTGEAVENSAPKWDEFKLR